MTRSAGEYIRAKRVEAGLTLTDVSRATGLSATYLSDIERGRRPLPTRWAEPLADAIGADADGLRCPHCGEAYRDTR